MGFFPAVASCLRQYATFSGKASRPEFWWFFLFQLLLFLVAEKVAGTALGKFVSVIIQLGLFLPGLAVGARRLHDVGRSGWWQLLIPTGIGLLLLLYWWVQPSEE